MGIADWSETLLGFPITWTSREGGCQVQYPVMTQRSYVCKYLFTALLGQLEVVNAGTIRLLLGNYSPFS